MSLSELTRAAAEQAERLHADARGVRSDAQRRLRRRKTVADALFMAGLLLGGPLLTGGGDLRAGLFVVLAGGLASVLQRYTDWSTVGTLVTGAVAAATVAVLVMDPADDVEPAVTDPEARGAFAEALSGLAEDVFVEARGPGLITIWFTVPAGLSGECGDYPPAEVRTHLADLGFRRVVVTQRNQSGGLCSFVP